MPDSERRRAPLGTTLLVALLTLSWGINWPVLKFGAATLPPLWFRSLGLVGGTVLLGLAVAFTGRTFRLPRRAAVRIFVLAIPNVVVWYGAVTIAVTMLPAGRAAILGFTMPAWSAAIGAIVYREPLDARTAIGVALAVAGIALLVLGAGDLGGHAAGVALMLAAAFAWAWGTHLFKRATLDVDLLAVTFWMFAFASVVLLATSAATEAARWRMPAGREWLPILYNAVVVIAAGNVVWFTVARRLSATAAGLASMLIPVVGVFASRLGLDERPSTGDLAALALICGAVALALVPRAASPGRAKVGARDDA